MMTANEYQSAASRTLIDRPKEPFSDEELAIIFTALELGAKVGKVLEYIKKGICHRHGFDRLEMNKELINVTDRAVALMTLDAPYQQLIVGGTEQMILWCALGLGGEAGEAMEEASMIRHFDLFNIDGMIKELGDNDWYNAALCTLIGVSMSEVMEKNIAKLIKRYPNGYASADSLTRVDVKG